MTFVAKAERVLPIIVFHNVTSLTPSGVLFLEEEISACVC